MGLTIIGDRHLKAQVHRVAMEGSRAGFAIQELKWSYPLADLTEFDEIACQSMHGEAELFEDITHHAPDCQDD
jgi:hypothetical protein